MRDQRWMGFCFAAGLCLRLSRTCILVPCTDPNIGGLTFVLPTDCVSYFFNVRTAVLLILVVVVAPCPPLPVYFSRHCLLHEWMEFCVVAGGVFWYVVSYGARRVLTLGSPSHGKKLE